MTNTSEDLLWAVVRTAYHGGGIVSRHRSPEAAERAARRQRVPDCVCKCAVVILAADVDALPYATDAKTPYSAAR